MQIDGCQIGKAMPRADSVFRTRSTPPSRKTPGQPLFRSAVDAVVAAYAQSDLFAKRRSLMEQWEAWCVG